MAAAVPLIKQRYSSNKSNDSFILHLRTRKEHSAINRYYQKTHMAAEVMEVVIMWQILISKHADNNMNKRAY